MVDVYYRQTFPKKERLNITDSQVYKQETAGMWFWYFSLNWPLTNNKDTSYMKKFI